MNYQPKSLALTPRPILYFAALLMAALYVAALSGCAKLVPKSGDTCVNGEAVCHGTDGALVCSGGKYVTTSCGGKGGCVRQSDRHVKCDQTAGAKPGQLCVDELYMGQSQCVDGGDYVTCMGGTWTGASCAIGKCAVAGPRVQCQ